MLQHPDSFEDRHLGPSPADVQEMLTTIGADSLSQLMDQTLPSPIRLTESPQGWDAESEFEYLKRLRTIAQQNQVLTSYIGQGYYDCITPSVILRNIFENPGWYTQYTPYQAEISQGRLEALLNFQTMVSDLTGLPVANASLLDEGTAAAEAMSMVYGQKQKKDRKSTASIFLVADSCFPQTIEVVQTRAEAVGLEVQVVPVEEMEITDQVFGALVQYPDALGEIRHYQQLAEQLHAQKAYLVVAADLLALTLLEAPGSWGADVVVGSSQRFGVP
ncbi:MAG: glycine dehydrogenase (aminomethyl-transferring), partial [Bacteroidota bacterium]